LIKFKKTLIVEQRREYVIEIKDILRDHIEEVEFAFDGKTALEIYDSFKPDLVLVEAILPKYDGFTLLEKIIDDNLIKIMLTCVNNELIIKKAFNLKVDYLFVKPYTREIFLKRLLEAAELKRSNQTWNIDYDNTVVLKNMISDLLRQLGIPANMLGYRYIRDGLLLMCGQKQGNQLASSESLYRILAETHGTNHKCIERNIRYAIEMAVTRGDPDLFNQYFSYSINSNKGKPTNSEFLATLGDIIHLKRR
jgi:two-component system response regulator (stage 0 sporulation protein A)